MVTAVFWERYKPKKANDTRAYLEINLDNLEHNVRILEKAMPCKLMAVVKAEAYGHGLYEIATHIHRMGVRAFAVATIEEGIALRRYGVSGEILILGYTAPTRAKELHKYDLMQTLPDYAYACFLNQQRYSVKAHIKIDTGMHRLGFEPEDIEKVTAVFAMKQIQVCGMYTHLSVADSLEEHDQSFTHQQIACFEKLVQRVKEAGIPVPKIHIQSSYGLLNYPELECDYVRAGIALYGVLSSLHDRTNVHLDLRPVLSLKAKVILIRNVPAGDAVGYGRSFVTKRETQLAVVSIGYADGYPRILSEGKSWVLINGYRAPIVGKICMDQLTADVTDIPHVAIGMTVTLIGMDGKEEISAPMVAEEADSITNELLSRMGRRCKIICKREGICLDGHKWA